MPQDLLQFQWKPSGWTDSEKALLKRGMALYGLDCLSIQHHLLPPKSEDSIRAHMQASHSVLGRE